MVAKHVFECLGNGEFRDSISLLLVVVCICVHLRQLKKSSQNGLGVDLELGMPLTYAVVTQCF